MRACRAVQSAAVQELIDCFSRDADGHWMCTKACEVALPGGRVQFAVGTGFTKGTMFMDVDIAELLDTEYRKTHP